MSFHTESARKFATARRESVDATKGTDWSDVLTLADLLVDACDEIERQRAEINQIYREQRKGDRAATAQPPPKLIVPGDPDRALP